MLSFFFLSLIIFFYQILFCCFYINFLLVVHFLTIISLYFHNFSPCLFPLSLPFYSFLFTSYSSSSSSSVFFFLFFFIKLFTSFICSRPGDHQGTDIAENLPPTLIMSILWASVSWTLPRQQQFLTASKRNMGYIYKFLQLAILLLLFYFLNTLIFNKSFFKINFCNPPCMVVKTLVGYLPSFNSLSF